MPKLAGSVVKPRRRHRGSRHQRRPHRTERKGPFPPQWRQNRQQAWRIYARGYYAQLEERIARIIRQMDLESVPMGESARYVANFINAHPPRAGRLSVIQATAIGEQYFKGGVSWTLVEIAVCFLPKHSRSFRKGKNIPLSLKLERIDGREEAYLSVA